MNATALAPSTVKRRVVPRKIVVRRPETTARKTEAQTVAAIQSTAGRPPKTNAELAALLRGNSPDPTVEQLMQRIRDSRAEHKRLAAEAEARGEEWDG